MNLKFVFRVSYLRLYLTEYFALSIFWLIFMI